MDKTCCFIGHRNINETEALKTALCETMETLITHNGVDRFLFGSKSRFNDLCYGIVSDIKKKYPHIRRIYVRAEFPNISESYEEYLSGWFEETYYPERIVGAGRAVYAERNFEMIDKSDYCLFYCNEEFLPSTRKSGTKIALDYAKRNNKKLIVFSRILGGRK